MEARLPSQAVVNLRTQARAAQLIPAKAAHPILAKEVRLIRGRVRLRSRVPRRILDKVVARMATSLRRAARLQCLVSTMVPRRILAKLEVCLTSRLLKVDTILATSAHLRDHLACLVSRVKVTLLVGLLRSLADLAGSPMRNPTTDITDIMDTTIEQCEGQPESNPIANVWLVVSELLYCLAL